eukprot:GILI01000569.1.p1 GENE.GILI01000569.1~~GILI01000569.1.p1  ORF type:complete len:308 (+),score=138.97 GILI01000569.1:53-925(+)
MAAKVPVEIPIYKDIAKPINDIFNEDYSFDKKFNLKIKSKKDGVEYAPTFNLTHNNAVLGNLGIKNKHACGLSVDLKAVTEGKHTAEFKYANSKKLGGLTLIANGSVNPAKNLVETGLGAEFKHDYARFKTAFDLTMTPTVSANVVLGNGTYGLGLDGSFNSDKGELTNYNGALYYKNLEHLFVLQTKTVGDRPASQFSLGYYNRLNKTSELGVELQYNHATQQKLLVAGAKHELDTTSFVKTKVDTDGKLGLHYQHQLNSMVKLGLSSQVDVTKLSADNARLGVSLTFE